MKTKYLYDCVVFDRKSDLPRGYLEVNLTLIVIDKLFKYVVKNPLPDLDHSLIEGDIVYLIKDKGTYSTNYNSELVYDPKNNMVWVVLKEEIEKSW